MTLEDERRRDAERISAEFADILANAEAAMTEARVTGEPVLLDCGACYVTVVPAEKITIQRACARHAQTIPDGR